MKFNSYMSPYIPFGHCSNILECVEGAVSQSLCPTCMDKFSAFHSHIVNLQVDLFLRKVKPLVLEALQWIFPACHHAKMGERQWRALRHLLCRPEGQLFHKYCDDWQEFSMDCLAKCPDCKVCSDPYRLQDAYALVRRNFLARVEARNFRGVERSLSHYEAKYPLLLQDMEELNKEFPNYLCEDPFDPTNYD